MISFGVAVHGGVGSSGDLSDGCRAAGEAAFSLLKGGGSALDAVVEAARILEDDGRFNAGSGSALRLDGKTIEMDAGVMDSRDNVGMVISVRGVRNPVLAAKAVMLTPHVALSGQGATDFARKQGLLPLGQASPRALAQFERVRDLIKQGRLGDEDPRWRGRVVESLWNFEESSYSDLFHCDTIGAVAVDKEGTLAVANSTGGASPMMLGRVGDSPLIGCGFYAGPACAVAVTGIGEEIIRRMLAKHLYDGVLQGGEIRAVCEKGIGMFPSVVPIGIIGISRTGYSIVANREMASSVFVEES